MLLLADGILHWQTHRHVCEGMGCIFCIWRQLYENVLVADCQFSMGDWGGGGGVQEHGACMRV